MPSRRTVRINDFLREEISQLIRVLKDPRLAEVISVTEVETSPDLRSAKVFISVYGTEEERQQTMDVLMSSVGFLRRELKSRVTLKTVPQLILVRDNSIEGGARLQSLIDQVSRQREGDE